MIDETLFFIHTTIFIVVLIVVLHLSCFVTAKRHKTNLVLLSADVFVSKFASPAFAIGARYNDDDGKGKRGGKNTDRHAAGGGGDGGSIFFLKTLLAPRLAIVAREKNGKTIFCRFAPSSPRSLSFIAFFLVFCYYLV